MLIAQRMLYHCTILLLDIVELNWIILYANMCGLFNRYLEEFEKKIPRAEMLELQVLVFLF